ncbi:hypothetical protein BCR37DRAFT_345592 [Protomyces lactucae-debilis]|uniref:Small ribosomal subunit protein uS13m n=1 Tax=Protomyces lactucae-debilis TaxID=2754530 RepID=A0A1Y2FM50_PROLT|nr:uncharacterized protein BCR37DRAFT_345592 [Protomyces lactucae-debilis]ORY84296.1 hypothetical protein BCR37DRAFT_345592 [Protomyces lactucae-debilis]
MVLLLGQQLPDGKKIQFALLAFYGIGHHTALKTLDTLHIPPNTLVSQLTEEQTTALGAHLAGMTIESDLRRQVRADIAHLRQVGTYRGRRHAMGLPVRGQNTQNNSKTARKLNRVERRGYMTMATSTMAAGASIQQGVQAGRNRFFLGLTRLLPRLF